MNVAPRFASFVGSLCLLGGVVVGCGARDPGWILHVRNESAMTLLVAVDDGHRRVLFVPSDAFGSAYFGFGAFKRGIVVLGTDCTVRSTVDAPAEGSFLLSIDTRGEAVLESRELSTDVVPLRQLAGICGADVACELAPSPWPTPVPGLGAAVSWCKEGS